MGTCFNKDGTEYKQIPKTGPDYNDLDSMRYPGICECLTGRGGGGGLAISELCCEGGLTLAECCCECLNS